MLDKEEELLVKGCIDWNKKDQKMLYDRFCSKMFAVCLRYSANREEAEDNLQEGFMKVFENIHKFKGEGSLEGWIRRIIVNTALEKFRKSNSKMVFADFTMNGNGAHFDIPSNDTADSHLHAKELLGLIQKLPPACRTIFNLYVFEDFKHKEIAAQLGISEGTSKSSLSYARGLLQKALKRVMSYES